MSNTVTVTISANHVYWLACWLHFVAHYIKISAFYDYDLLLCAKGLSDGECLDLKWGCGLFVGCERGVGCDFGRGCVCVVGWELGAEGICGSCDAEELGADETVTVGIGAGASGAGGGVELNEGGVGTDGVEICVGARGVDSGADGDAGTRAGPVGAAGVTCPWWSISSTNKNGGVIKITFKQTIKLKI